MNSKDLAKIRQAVLSVIDEKSWDFYEADYLNGLQISEDTANRNRLDFCDAVVAELTKADPLLRATVGGALVVTLPQHVARFTKLVNGDTVTIVAHKNGTIIVTPTPLSQVARERRQENAAKGGAKK